MSRYILVFVNIVFTSELIISTKSKGIPNGPNPNFNNRPLTAGGPETPLFAVDWSTGATVQSGSSKPRLNFICDQCDASGPPAVIKPKNEHNPFGFGFLECRNTPCTTDGPYVQSDPITQEKVTEKTIEVIVNRHPCGYRCDERCGMYDYNAGGPFGIQVDMWEFDSFNYNSLDNQWMPASDGGVRSPDPDLYDEDWWNPYWEILHITYSNDYGIQMFRNGQTFGPLYTQNKFGDDIKLFEFDEFSMIFCTRGIGARNPFFSGMIRSAALFGRVLSDNEIVTRSNGYPIYNSDQGEMDVVDVNVYTRNVGAIFVCVIIMLLVVNLMVLIWSRKCYCSSPRKIKSLGYGVVKGNDSEYASDVPLNDVDNIKA